MPCSSTISTSTGYVFMALIRVQAEKHLVVGLEQNIELGHLKFIVEKPRSAPRVLGVLKPKKNK